MPMWGPGAGASVLAAVLGPGEVELHHQPRVHPGSGGVCGVESLVRWRRVDGTLVGADRVLEAAATSDVHRRALVESVWAGVLEVARAWWQRGWELAISWNVDVHDLARDGFVEGILDDLDRAGLSPRAIRIELTEHGTLADLEPVRRSIETLERAGVRTALDDFGVAHSALARLQLLEVSELKIDRRFVTGCPTTGRLATVLEHVVALGRALGLVVVAEGIESAEDLDLVNNMGVNLVQGFAVCPPLPRDEVELWLLGRCAVAELCEDLAG